MGDPMFCTSCGVSLLAGAKFCQACGSPVAPMAAVPTVPTPQAVGPTAVQRIFGDNADDAERAKREIIDAVDVTAMLECARHALDVNDAERADFWYLEVITAPGARSDVVNDAIVEYAHRVLETEQRFAEMELYLDALVHAADRSAQERGEQEVQRVRQLRKSRGIRRFQVSKAWKSVDVSQPLAANTPAEAQYLRAIALAHAQADAGKLDKLIDRSDREHLSYVAGYVIGVRGSKTPGIDIEACIQGLIDALDALRRQRGAGRSEGSKSTAAAAAAPARVSTSVPAKAGPKENRLGKDVDAIFTDRKLAAQIKAGFGCTDGVNDDYIVAWIPVSAKLGAGIDANHYLVVTNEQIGIFKKGGVFGGAEALVLTRRQIAFIGIGESDHYEAEGFGGSQTAWVSITVEIKSGQQYTRHFHLGQNEREINKWIPFIKDDLASIARAGYPIGDGPAWTSSGGYRTSVGWGIGVWN